MASCWVRVGCMASWQAVKRKSKEARRGDRDRQSKRKAGHNQNATSPRSHAEHARLLRAKGHENADFFAARVDVVRHDAVDLDDGQSQRKVAEESGVHLRS